MNRKHVNTGLVLATLTAAGIGSVAYAKEAHNSATDEAAIIASSKVTLSQAIAAAEQATGGKAVGSGIEDREGTVHLEVTVIKDGARQKVLVDTQTGTVVKTVAAAKDDDGHSDSD